jgi:hypothetical protein
LRGNKPFHALQYSSRTGDRAALHGALCIHITVFERVLLDRRA